MQEATWNQDAQEQVGANSQQDGANSQQDGTNSQQEKMEAAYRNALRGIRAVSTGALEGRIPTGGNALLHSRHARG